MSTREEISKCVEKRVLNVADYIIENKATIRETAKVFGASKYTIHLDATVRIFNINPKKAIEVEKVLLFNKSQRHLRGGEATRRRYKSVRELNRQAF